MTTTAGPGPSAPAGPARPTGSARPAPSAAPAGSAGRSRRLGDWAAGLRLDDVPDRIVEWATSQVLSQLAAIRAGLAHPSGRMIVRAFGPPWHPDPRRSAAVLGALGSWLNLDDTAYAGHLSSATVAVPLAYAHALPLSGRDLLTAVITGNEYAARITAAATLGPLRGQSALHTLVAGAVSTRLRIENAPAQRWADALGLALAAPSWPLLRGFLGSDAKLVHAVGPIRTAMDACDAAAAGLRGAADIVEHPDGFLARFATVALPEAVDAGLGVRWHTETLSFKMRPGGPGVDAAVDCAVELHRELGGLTADDVDEIVIDTSLYTLLFGRKAASYQAGPDTPLSALLLDTAYPVATALLTGGLTPADFSAPAVRDPARWALAAKVRLTHDPAMTADLLGSTAPFGEALRLAGDRAAGWLGELTGGAGTAVPGGAPAGDFRTARKATPARVTVRLRHGGSRSAVRTVPLGAVGPHTRSQHRALVRAKFLAQGGPADVADALDRLPDLSPATVRDLLRRALASSPGTRVSEGSAGDQPTR